MSCKHTIPFLESKYKMTRYFKKYSNKTVSSVLRLYRPNLQFYAASMPINNINHDREPGTETMTKEPIKIVTVICISNLSGS